MNMYPLSASPMKEDIVSQIQNKEQKKWVEDHLRELEQTKIALMQEVDKLNALLHDREKTMTSLKINNEKTLADNKKL